MTAFVWGQEAFTQRTVDQRFKTEQNKQKKKQLVSEYVPWVWV